MFFYHIVATCGHNTELPLIDMVCVQHSCIKLCVRWQSPSPLPVILASTPVASLQHSPLFRHTMGDYDNGSSVESAPTAEIVRYQTPVSRGLYFWVTFLAICLSLFMSALEAVGPII